MNDVAMDAKQTGAELATWLNNLAAEKGSQPALNPGHVVPFLWPPKPVSYDYHLNWNEATEEAMIHIHGEHFVVHFIQNSFGVFGRVEKLWHEAKGSSREDVVLKLTQAAEPLFRRQLAIASIIGRNSRFTGKIDDLPPLDLLKLLFAEDRDIVREATTSIETHASLHVFQYGLLAILSNTSHPYRRSAQWAVLDLLEDLPAFFSPEEEAQAVNAIKTLLWDASDDIARTMYKAGVVLGGHICSDQSAAALLACFDAPSPIGRRSVYHASFHLAEWMPEWRERIVEGFEKREPKEDIPVLQEYIAHMHRDIKSGSSEHVADPMFPDED